MKALGDYVRTIPDFPKPGIMFRDITTILQDPDGLFIQGFHGAKQGCFLVQRFTAVRTVGGGDAENMFLDKGIGSRIPGGIPTGFEGGTQAAGRQGGSIRLAADKFLPGIPG